MNYQIISDGACDLLHEYTEKHNVEIVPFYVSFDGNSYTKEGDGIDHDTFYKKMIEEHAVPKSSLPSVQDYIDKFEWRQEMSKSYMGLGHETIFRALHKKFSEMVANELMKQSPEFLRSVAGGAK